MNNPTALKQYVLPMVFGSGDIDTLFVDDAGTGLPATMRIHYRKVGNLYFGFWGEQLANNQIAGVVGGTSLGTYNDSLARLALILGITIDTAYRNDPNTGAFGFNAITNWGTGSNRWDSFINQTQIYQLHAILAV